MRLPLLFVGVLVSLSHCVFAQTVDEASGELGNVQVAPAVYTALVGERVEFQCVATMADSQKELTWSREVDGRPGAETINAATSGFEVFTPNNASANTLNSVLRIKEVVAADSARYYCAYDTVRAAGILTVTYEGLVDIIGNHVLEDEMDMNFTCLVDGSANYTVTWKKNVTYELPNKGLPNVEIQGNLLTIKKASIEHDRGNYTCSSSYNGVAVSAKITVGGAIRIKAPISVKFTEGERARFECIAIFPTGDPEPGFTWYIGNETVISDANKGGRYDIKHSKWDTGSVLHMTDVVFEDAGNYTCIANSPVTTVEHTTQLRVRDRLAALWPFIGIMSEVILLIIIIFIHEKCTQGDDIGEEDEEDEGAEPIKEKEKISLDGEGDMRMRSSKP